MAEYTLPPSISEGMMGDDTADAAAVLERGDCPWCEDYDGDHPGRHASKAHPDEWAAHREE